MTLGRKTTRILKRDHDTLIKELWAEGLSDSEIADELGIIRSTVSHIRLRLGLPSHQKRGGNRRKKRNEAV